MQRDSRTASPSTATNQRTRCAEWSLTSDVLVQPSVVAPNGDMDGIPNALIEAMALGIPVVTTSVSGIPELVSDGVTGVVVRPGDPEELAAGLQRVIEDPEAARKRAAAGLATVSAEFDIADSAAAMASLLERR